MDEAKSHYPQQTNTGIENKTLHVLTHKWELKNENIWAQGGEHHTSGPVGGVEGKGKDSISRNTNVDDGLMGATKDHGTCMPL